MGGGVGSGMVQAVSGVAHVRASGISDGPWVQFSIRVVASLFREPSKAPPMASILIVMAGPFCLTDGTDGHGLAALIEAEHLGLEAFVIGARDFENNAEFEPSRFECALPCAGGILSDE